MIKASLPARRIKWHPGFWGGIELELSDYRDALIFEPEHQLGKEPLRMDMLVIKKDPVVIIDDEIGQIFREHNIVEYKSPEDALSQDDFYKVLGYAYLYKGLGARVDAVPLREMTVSFFRDRYPRKLISDLKQQGADIEERFPGVYYVEGVTNIPVQIIVTGRLSHEHPVLRMLSRRAGEEDLQRFIRRVVRWDTPGDRNNITAVLEVSGAANRALFKEYREGGKSMPEVLREIFKEDLEAAEARGESRGESRGAIRQSIRMYKNCLARGMSDADARALSELPEDYDVSEI